MSMFVFRFGPQFLCILTVCGRRIDGCCRRGIVDCQPPPSWGRGWAPVYPVLSLDIATCSVAVRLPFFISLFPFFHLWSLFFKFFSVSHFFRLSGEYLLLVGMSSCSAYYAVWSAFLLPGIFLWLGTHRRVIFGPSLSNIFRIVRVLGFFVGVRL
jgi:hypothetical protein